MTHPWQPAFDHYRDKTQPLLLQHGLDIGQAVHRGDREANRIAELSQQLWRSFDPVTALLLEEALQRWLAQPHTPFYEVKAPDA